MMTFVALFTLNLTSARATERTFKCLARSKLAVTMMVIGTYESATTEPTGPVRIAGRQSSGSAGSTEVLGSPDDPVTFDIPNLTLDYESLHKDFLARGSRDDGARFFLSRSPQGGHLEFVRPGRVNLRFDAVTCVHTDGHDPDDWSWSDSRVGWPY